MAHGVYNYEGRSVLSAFNLSRFDVIHLSIVQKHFAQTCSSITLLTCKHFIRCLSSMAKPIIFQKHQCHIRMGAKNI